MWRFLYVLSISVRTISFWLVRDNIEISRRTHVPLLSCFSYTYHLIRHNIKSGLLFPELTQTNCFPKGYSETLLAGGFHTRRRVLGVVQRSFGVFCSFSVSHDSYRCTSLARRVCNISRVGSLDLMRYDLRIINAYAIMN